MKFDSKRDIRKQIQEDIADYQVMYPNVPNIAKDEWAFNFWILDKFFNIDEDIIPEYIIDYNDKGVDCYVWHEELKNLYIIQNKYYDDSSIVTNSYIENDFLTRALGALEKGTYSRSPELQEIFTKFKDDPEFQVYMNIYVTNEIKKPDVLPGIKKYNNEHNKYTAQIFYLSDIEDLYYGRPIEDKKTLTVSIRTKNKGTTLNVNNQAYGTNQAIDARYALIPVNNIYEIFKKSLKENYSLFDQNIRDYLGDNGPVNNKIVGTLNDDKERKNFFYYNNGITIICDKMTPISPNGEWSTFDIINPQVVNGCQTVNSIYQVLNSKSDDYRKKEYSDTYVMIKILVLDSTDEEKKTLYKNIVRYNNSQNSIDENSFVAVDDTFRRLQEEFLKKGFLLCIKQSDKNSFKQEYSKPQLLLDKNKDLIDRFGLNYSKTSDFLIDLPKLLQVCSAFCLSAQVAFQKKSKMLDRSNDVHIEVVKFIKSTTTNSLICLYLLFAKSEKMRKKNEKNPKVPVSFYVIDCFSHYECKGDQKNILKELSTKDSIDKIMKTYKLSTGKYLQKHIIEKEGNSYTSMNKLPIDYVKMDEYRQDALSYMDE